MQYLELLKTVVGDQNTSHILMTTHDHLVIAGVELEQVKILHTTDEMPYISVASPETDPIKMGYPEILTNIFYLRSVIYTYPQKLDH